MLTLLYKFDFPAFTYVVYLQTERCRTTDGLVDEMFTALFSNEDNEEKRAQVWYKIP